MKAGSDNHVNRSYMQALWAGVSYRTVGNAGRLVLLVSLPSFGILSLASL